MSTHRLLAAVLSAAALAAPAPARAEHPLARRYLDGLLSARPHLATFMGDHRFDGVLWDLSPEALEKRERELAALEKDLASAKVESLDDRIDGSILSDGIALELLYLREIRDWEWDPRLYDSFPYYDPREVVAWRLSTIIHGDFAPREERLGSVTSELKAFPRYLAQVRAALAGPSRHPSKEYLEQGVKANRGRIEFFETELKEFTAGSPGAEAARTEAVGALRGFQELLEKGLSARADGDWRLGADLYRKKFPLALGTSLTLEEVAPRAQAAFQEARKGLLEVAIGLHERLWPGETLPRERLPPEEARKVIERVREEISKDHPAPAELVQAHARTLEGLRKFIEEHRLLDLPPRETLSVEPMPPFKRGSTAAEYLAPGVLERGAAWRAVYYVDPIDPAWPAEKVESYLRGQNTYEVELTASHEAYPGHHTQYFYSRRNPNPLRAVLWNAAMVEGWAVYGEGLMVREGWGGDRNDRYRFYDFRGRMIVATNILLDIGLHTGRMGEAEALRLMEEEGFQEKAMAEKKLLRAKLDSTQLAQYFLGLDEIRSLEAEARKKEGAAWTQRGFDEALIGRGSIAVKFLRKYLLGD